MLSDEFPEMGIVGPKALNGTTFSLNMYVADVDKATAKAVAAGATVKRPAADEFYGERSGQIEDPFVHVWMLHTRFETVTPREMRTPAPAVLHFHGGGHVLGVPDGVGSGAVTLAVRFEERDGSAQQTSIPIGD